MASIGQYRDENGWVMVHYDGGHSAPIPRERYEGKEYQPPYDDLPTKEEYEARHATGPDGKECSGDVIGDTVHATPIAKGEAKE